MNVLPDPVSFIDGIKAAKVRVDNDMVRVAKLKRELDTAYKLLSDSQETHDKIWREFRESMGYTVYE